MSIKKFFGELFVFSILTISLIMSGCNHTAQKEEANETMISKIDEITNVKMSELTPGSPDMELAVEKGIIDDVSEESEYLKMEYKYLSLLNLYLTSTARLNQYQRILDKSELNFPVEDGDIYFKRGSFGRSNIAIRNRAFIERLSEDDIEFLKELPDDTIEYSEELDIFVSRTWEELINVVLEEGKTKPHTIVYDIDAVNKISAMSNALTFELVYNLEYENGKLTGDTEEKYKKASEVAERMETELANEIGHEVAVFIKVR